MRRLPFLALLVLAVPIWAQAPAETPSSPLPGVPVTQEQHHHLVLENPYIKTYEVEVAAHDTTLMHQHIYDYVYVVFGDADLINKVAGKPEAKLQVPDSTVNFSRGPFAHIAANHGDTVFRNITIELLRPQGEMKKYYPSIAEALKAGTPDANGIRQVGLLETDEMRVVAAAVSPQRSWSPAHDGRDRLVIMLDKIHDTSGPTEKNSPFPAGMLAWAPADSAWSVPNKSAQEMRLMVLEFKDAAR